MKQEVFRTGTSAGMAKSRKGPKSGVWTEVAKMSPGRKQVIIIYGKKLFRGRKYENGEQTHSLLNWL